jgi:hypothetical protein
VATRALPPGALRRRTAFGLLDADGWTWASIKALFWFLLILFLLAYLPDRLYYFTVSPTIDVGYNVISPVNLCPAENRGLACPAPAGAVVPWDESPDELALPEPRSAGGTYSSGENLYLVGGRSGEAATETVLTTLVTEGNLAPWAEAPPLPEARSDAVVVNLAGTPYVIGGRDAGGAATDTVLRGTLDEGIVTGWEQVDEIALPAPMADATGVPTVDGIWLMGGRDEGGNPSNVVYRAGFDTAIPPSLEQWEEVTELPLPEARADASAVIMGNFIYVLGGEGPEGPSNSVFFMALDGEGQPQLDATTERHFGWGVAVGEDAPFAMPEPRMRHTSFTNGGAIYVLGGEGPDGALQATNYWAVPDSVTGTIPEWRRDDATELPAAMAEASAAVIGANVFVIGGEREDGPSASLARADLSPALPFFRLGLFGVTVPALGIQGEIGQQLGYLTAAGVGTANFVILIIIGVAFSHPRATMRLIERVTRGRFRAPRDEEYEA